MINTDHWALLGKLNIPWTYKANRTWWRLESHGSHTVNGVQLIPGAPGFTPKAAYLMWTGLFGVLGASSAAPLTLTGTNGNDTLTGDAGDDSFTGGAGADSLIGGAGNDTFNVSDTAGDGSDTINGGDGTADTIAVTAGQTIVFATNDANITGVENITLGAAASVTLTGQTEGFNITGSTGNETVVAGSGNDTIAAGAGVDSINGGGGADAIDVGADADVDTVALTAAADSFAGSISTGTTNLGASIDVVSNLAAGDRFDLTALGLNASINGAAVSSNLAAVSTAGGWGLIRGTYVNGVFTENTGTDTHTLLVYDTNGAGAGSDLGAVVLVGVFGGSAVNGMVTLAAPAVPGVTLAGDGTNNTLTGGVGDDTLSGGAGLDSLSGAGGNDIFNLTNTAEDASDTIDGGAGSSDTISVSGTIVFANNDANITGVENITLGAGASVTLTGQLEGFNITGGSGNETVVCGAGDDTIAGGAGNDDINAGGGINVVTDAGQGNDTIRRSITGGSTTISVTGTGTVTLIATTADAIANSAAGVNTVVNATSSSGQGAVTLNGNTGNDSLTGGALADTITGGAGVDTLTGGSGDDTFYVTTTADDGNDSIVGGAGSNDTIAVAAGAAIAFAVDANLATVEKITLGAGASVTLTGQTEAFTITGTTSAEQIVGGAGHNTTFNGFGGADTLTGGAGNDVFNFASSAQLAQAASVNGGAGSDRVAIATGTSDLAIVDSDFTRVSEMENLFVTRTAGSHVLTLGTVTSAAYANGISVFLYLAGSSAVEIQGSLLTVRISISTIPDISASIQGGSGNDNLLFGATSLSDSSINGGFGNDSIRGGSGSDTLVGGDGQDSIQGNIGSDLLTGGPGSDQFLYSTASHSNANSAIDRITDLVLDGANGDLLDFSLTGTLSVRTATVSANSTGADTQAEITGLFNSATGTVAAGERFTGGSNATAVLATFNDGMLLVVDVNGDGVFNASDVVINITGVTVTDFTTACFI
ncbi:calcium-binding protein [Limnohabitans sp.]|uniref:beta strand repeat-containing protein n=1 Tax=Limnohabitans sp. TaxID=1907725 RepID=UPI002AFEDC39|nr:calcium-binding protein [Limnohabitans sp.]